LARAEERHDPNASLFVGAFGLDVAKYPESPPTVDLCGLVDALLHLRLVLFLVWGLGPWLDRFLALVEQ
jgi:hypothetical protein